MQTSDTVQNKETKKNSVIIPFVKLTSDEKNRVLPKLLEEIEKLVDRSDYILGEKVKEFESAFALVAGTQYAVAVNSGLDALLLSLRASGIGTGDEVITVPNTFIATVAAIELVGATPVFVDVDNSYNLNPELLEEAITPRTKAIIPVHLTGHPCDMDRIQQVAEKHQLFILEDAAQSIGATYRGRKVGSLGYAAAFSLHPLKNLHVWGDGGVITTNDSKLYANLLLQRNHGLVNRNECRFFSYNSRLDSIHAIVGLEYLKLLENVTQRRIQNASYYHAYLKDLGSFLTLPPLNTSAENRSAYHVFQMRVSQREKLISFLESEGIETKIHYPIPIHAQEAAKHLKYKWGDFPVTEQLSREILSVPVRENLFPHEVDFIAKKIKSFYLSA